MFTVLFLSTLISVAFSYNVKVVSTVNEGDRGLEPCLTQCYGSTGATTAWYGGSEYAYTNFDITECGFLAGTSPMVSTSLSGKGYENRTNGGVLRRTSTTQYRVHVYFQHDYNNYNVLEKAKQYKWRVDWTAVGYWC